MPFVNIHTHHHQSNGGIQLVNHFIQEDFSNQSDISFSSGLHPWHIQNTDWDPLLQKLEMYAEHNQIRAIGECGLDRAIETPLKRQEELFIRQVELAERFQKPLILHVVKSYSDIIRIKKNRTPSIPWILHAYQGNQQTTQQLLPHEFYFSFGPQLLKGQEKLANSLKQIPLKKLFFETDDSTDKIETIYIFAAQILGLTVTELQELVFNNYQRIFGNG
ncbi:TatD family hydrolase [Sunxiuqinia sp. sy24]|uniref:TatD family hydrolase n=1 Tax=Sunxiuqinia sp. sy24 TaxID=3461495 RepID=UPI00404674DD